MFIPLMHFIKKILINLRTKSPRVYVNSPQIHFNRKFPLLIGLISHCNLVFFSFNWLIRGCREIIYKVSLQWEQERKFLNYAGHILDPYCVQPSNAAPFFENYTKLYFDAKHLEKGLKRRRGWSVCEIFGAFFLNKSVLFFIKSALSGQYRTLP